MDLNEVTSISLNGNDLTKWVCQNNEIMWEASSDVGWDFTNTQVLSGLHKHVTTYDGIWVDGAPYDQDFWNRILAAS